MEENSYIIKCTTSTLNGTLEILSKYVKHLDSVFIFKRNDKIMLLVDLNQQQVLSLKIDGLEISLDSNIVIIQ